MLAKQAFVDKNICIGCSVCSTECPDVFEVKQDDSRNGDFKSFTNDSLDQTPHEAKIDSAISKCPVQCISWKEKLVTIKT